MGIQISESLYLDSLSNIGYVNKAVLSYFGAGTGSVSISVSGVKGDS